MFLIFTILIGRNDCRWAVECSNDNRSCLLPLLECSQLHRITVTCLNAHAWREFGPFQRKWHNYWEKNPGGDRHNCWNYGSGNVWKVSAQANSSYKARKKPCLEYKLVYNSETPIDITEDKLKKLATVQYDRYKKALGVPRSTPNAAIVMRDYCNGLLVNKD